MIVSIEGEVRRFSEMKRKGGEIVKNKEGKIIYGMVIEQKTDGLTNQVNVGTMKNGRKVGDKVAIKANLKAVVFNGKGQIQAFEIG